VAQLVSKWRLAPLEELLRDGLSVGLGTMELRDYLRSLYDIFPSSFILGIYCLFNTTVQINKCVVLKFKAQT